MLLVVLTAVCVVAYMVEITFGLAGTILMIMVMSFFIDTKILVIFSVMPQILTAVIALLRSPQTVQLKFLGGMLVYAVAGSFLGIYLFYAFSPQVFQIALASMITVSGVFLVFGSEKFKVGTYKAHVLDTTAGISQALFGISGPIAMTRLLGTFDDKTRVRNYALAFFLSLNIFRLGSYTLNETITPEIGQMMLIVAPFLAVALWYSNHLHFKLNEKLFRLVVSWLILLGGVSLYFH